MVTKKAKAAKAAKKRTRGIKVNFFRVQMPKDAGSFADLLTSIGKMLIEDKNDIPADPDVAPVRIDHVESNATHVWGELKKLRMNELPPIGSLDDESETPISVTDRQGLKEGAAFVYEIANRVLALQQNAHGIGVHRLADYTRKVGNLTEGIFFDPILRPEAIERLLTMGTISRFHFRIAKIENFDVLDKMGFGVKRVSQLSKEFNSRNLEIVMSTRVKGGLSTAKIIEMAKELFQLKDSEVDQVTKLDVTGAQEADESNVPLNLLREFVRYSGSIQTDERSQAALAMRVAILKDGLKNKAADLKVVK